MAAVGVPVGFGRAILGAMRRIVAETLIGASKDEVWALLDDLAGMPRWLARVRAVTSISGPAHVGTMYRERTSILGIPSARDWEITEHRKPTRQVRVAEEGGLRRRMTLVLEPRGTGTLLHATMELESRMPGLAGALTEAAAWLPAAWGIRSFAESVKRAFEEATR
jgi:uncharacterized protein YndB with AHSA1/START domain